MKRKSTHITKETSELGYNIPQNYFDELEQSLLSKIKTENAENIHSKKLGFKVPDGYFESVNKAVLEQTKPKKGKLITLLLVHKYKISAIAAVLLVVFMVYNYNSAFC